MNTGVSSFLRIHILVCVLSAISAYGQGTTLVFCNNCLPSPPDRLVRDVDGTPLVGTNYLVQLYVGATTESLTAHTAAPTRLRPAETSLPGTWPSGNRTLTVPGPGPIVLQVRVWDVAAGTYEQASQDMTGLKYGKSEPFNYEPCGTPPLPNCELMLNFRGFTVMTNPPDRTLVIREKGAHVELLYSGTHTIQAAWSIRGPWTTVHSSTGPFTDPLSSTNSERFYRMMDEPGPTYSVNMVGYYRLNLCPGISLIANQLQRPGGNTIENVFKQPPEGTLIFKFRPDLSTYEMVQYVDGAWEGQTGLTLNPGEGVFIWSPTPYDNRFFGEVSAQSAIPIPRGISIVSSPLPESGPLRLLPPGLGFPVQEGDQVFQWYCYRTTYLYSLYAHGTWEGEQGAGITPTVDIGEAFFVIRSGTPGLWTRSFSVGP